MRWMLFTRKPILDMAIMLILSSLLSIMNRICDVFKTISISVPSLFSWPWTNWLWYGSSHMHFILCPDKMLYVYIDIFAYDRQRYYCLLYLNSTHNLCVSAFNNATRCLLANWHALYNHTHDVEYHFDVRTFIMKISRQIRTEIVWWISISYLADHEMMIFHFPDSLCEASLSSFKSKFWVRPYRFYLGRG